MEGWRNCCRDPSGSGRVARSRASRHRQRRHDEHKGEHGCGYMDGVHSEVVFLSANVNAMQARSQCHQSEANLRRQSRLASASCPPLSTARSFRLVEKSRKPGLDEYMGEKGG